MGSSSSKTKTPAHARNASSQSQTQGLQSAQSASVPTSTPPPPQAQLLSHRAGLAHAHRVPRTTRPDLPFLGLVGQRENATPDKPRETRQEREARKLEKERQARLKERERSMREESVDGGYLVTVGVYTGVEDFSKPTVRQLQVSEDPVYLYGVC